MGKGDSKTRARRRAKHQRTAPELPTLAPAPRASSHVAAMRDDPQRTCISRRLALMGWSRSRTSEAMEPMLGFGLGRAIYAMLDGDDRRTAWGAWVGYATSRHRYERMVLGRPSSPQAAALAILPESMEADTHHTVDLRDASQREVDAANARMIWRTRISVLGTARERMIDAAFTAPDEAMWDAMDHRATGTGAATAGALLALARVLEGGA